MVSGLMCTTGLNAGSRAHRGRYLPVAIPHPLPTRAEGRMCQTLAILASPEAEPKRETLWGQDHPSLRALDAVTCDLEQWQPSVAKYWQTCGQEDTSENGREEDDALGHVGHYGAASPDLLLSYNTNSQHWAGILHGLPCLGAWEPSHAAPCNSTCF